MNKYLILLFIVFAAWRPSGAQQQTGLPTEKVLFENEFVRVIEIHMQPGVAEPKHSHGHGVTVALTDYDNELTTYPDRAVTRRHTKFGEVRWAEAVTHEARNTGTTEQRVIRVEIKRDAAPEVVTERPDLLDSLVVCKDTQTLIFENQFVRVIQERVPPGVAQPMHSHRHGVLVPLADADIESVDDGGGKPVRRQLKFGDAGWRDAVVHSVRNVGKTELLNIRIEVK
jgi:predicted metal-dependent enzyme (double-stranded beta helix superfamily)